MMKFIKSLDRFGVAINPKVNKEDDLHRSVLGGFVTILLFMASATYGAYVFYKWQDGQLSPKITSTRQKANLDDIDISNIVYLSFWRSQENQIDPLKAQGNILTLYSTTDEKGIFAKLEYILNDDDTQLNKFGAKLLVPQLRKNLYRTEKGKDQWRANLGILLGKCNPNDQKEGSYCASEEEMEKYFQQPGNIITLYIETKTLNPLTQEVETSYADFTYQIEDKVCFTGTYFMNTIQYRVRNDLILDTEKRYDFIDSVSSNTQTNSIEFCKQAFGKDIYVQLNFVTMLTQTSQYQEFPNLGDLLANIGSIASALFMLRHIIYIINYHQLQDQLLNQIINIYYPEFKKLVYQYNYRRKLIAVTYRNKEINIEQLNQFRERMKSMLTNKLEFSNLIYEISRLQFIIRSFTSRDTIKKLHLIQLKLPFLSQNNVLQFCRTQQIQTENSQNNDNNDKKLLEEDCQIFSSNQRDKINQDDILMVLDELAVPDFFEINRQQED